MVKKRLNVKLLLVTAGVLLVAGLAVHGLHLVMVARHAQTLIAQADAATDPRQAAEYLHRSLLLQPNDLAVWLRYADTLEPLAVNSQEKDQLLAVYGQILSRDGNRQDVRRKAVALKLEVGKPADALKDLAKLVQANPTDGDLLDLQGRCLEQSGDILKAVDVYRQTLKVAPHRADTAVRLATLLRLRQEKPGDADTVLDELVTANPQLPVAFVARALWRVAFGDFRDAEKDVEQAVALAPEDVDVLVVQAEMAQLQGQTDEARQAWTKAIALNPTQLRLYLGLGGLELRSGHSDEALACFRDGLKHVLGSPELLHAEADVLLERGQLDEAAKVVEKLQQGQPPTGLVDYLKARLLMARGQWRPAVAALTGLTATPGLSPDLLSRVRVCLGLSYGHLDAPDLRLTAFEEAVAIAPYYPPARLGLASALLDLGRTDDALEQLRYLIRLAGAEDVSWLTLAQASIRHELSLPALKRDWREAENALDRAAVAASLATETTLLQAHLLEAQNRPNEAAALLEKATEKTPDKAALWQARAELAARRGDTSAAIRLLSDARQKGADRVAAAVAAVEFWERQGGSAAPKALAEIEKESASWPAEEQIRLLRYLVEAEARLGQFAEAERLARQLVERAKDDLTAHVRLVEVLLNRGSVEAVIAALAELRRVDGEDGTWWPCLRAALLVREAHKGDRAGLDQARKLLTEVEHQRPDWGRLALVQADLADLDGNTAKSLAASQRALAAGERAPGVALRVMRTLAGQGRFAEADRVAQTAQSGPPRRDFARLAAEIALQAGGVERALDLARQAVPADDRDYRDWLWLGSLRTTAGHKLEAEDAFRRAAELAPTLAEPWVALVAHLAQVHKPERDVEAVLKQVQSQVAPADRPLALARCYESLARFKEAAEQYTTAVQARPTDFTALQSAAAFHLRLGQDDAARPLLAKLLAPATAAPEEVLAWARRQEAMRLATAADEASLKKAATLLDGNRKLVGDTLADQRAKMFVDALRPGVRSSGVKAVEESSKKQPLSPEEQFRLARLYDQEDNWPRANEHFRSALATDQQNPFYLATFAAAVLHREGPDEARTWVDRLEKIEPDSPRTRELRDKVRTPVSAP